MIVQCANQEQKFHSKNKHEILTSRVAKISKQREATAKYCTFISNKVSNKNDLFASPKSVRHYVKRSSLEKLWQNRPSYGRTDKVLEVRSPGNCFTVTLQQESYDDILRGHRCDKPLYTCFKISHQVSRTSACCSQ